MEMKNKILMLISAVSLLFAACQKDDTMTAQGGGSDEIELSATITPFMGADGTRASIVHEGTGKIDFVKGDQIAVYITPSTGETIRRTATWDVFADAWQFDEVLTWKTLNCESATFAAYYPADEASLTLTAETGQEFGGKLENSDKLLMAKATVSRGNQVNLKFRHAMHFVQMNLKPQMGEENGYTTELRNATMYIHVYNKVTIDPATGNVSAPQGQPVKIRMRTQGTSEYRAVVCPQPVQNDWKTSVWIESANLAGKPFSFKAPATIQGHPFTELEPGYKTTINLSVGKKPIVIEDLTDKTLWVAGIKNIPSQTQWGWAYTETRSLGLKWQPEYGWYDVKKIDSVHPKFGDHRMCWAASASNMLHWWFDRNAENIRCYNEYKKATMPGFKLATNGYNSTTHKQSDIFDFFKRTCTDKGYLTSGGIKWFLQGIRFNNGSQGSSVKGTEESNAHEKQGGFFGDVMAYELSDYTESVPSSYDAGPFFKRHLDQGHAIGVDHQVLSGSHAIVLWGAAFDNLNDPETLSVLYACDNNQSDAELNHGNGVSLVPGAATDFGIFQYRIRKDAGAAKTYHLENGTKPGDYSVMINGLESLSPCTEAWQKFWQDSKFPKRQKYAPAQYKL